MALTQEDLDFMQEESEQKIADQSASFGKNPIDFMIKYTRGEVGKGADAIKRFGEEVDALNRNDAVSAKYRDEKIQEKRTAVEDRIDKMAARIEDKIQRAVTAAEKRAALPEIPAAEEALIAQVSAQDIEARQPEQWMELYEETARAGDRVKLSHLRRLLDPRMADQSAAWEMRKLKHRTAEEVSRDETLAAAESLRAQLPAIAVHFKSYLKDVKSIHEFIEMDALLNETEGNTRRAASEVSAQWKAINA
ncbi:MAG: hypothetical protein IBX71_10255 [Candidatus Desulforudis sp.]|nr:hypothetical protein [Desulforudis sp.]